MGIEGSSSHSCEYGSSGSSSTARASFYDPTRAEDCLRDASLRYRRTHATEEFTSVIPKGEDDKGAIVLGCVACQSNWTFDISTDGSFLVEKEIGGCGKVNAALVAAVQSSGKR